MRLYSKNQILLFTGILVVFLFVIAGFLGFLKFPWDNVAEHKNNTIDAYTGTPVRYDDDLNNPEFDNYTSDEMVNIDIYKNLNAGVVNITSISIGYNWFLEPVPQEGTGSGSIIDKNGYVLTNYHVIKDSEELYITLADGSSFVAEVIGVDPENDLAVLKFEPEGKDLAIIPFGSSSNLLVGQKVLAIGNPFALERTLTTGIVSGLGRPVQSTEQHIIKEMIQTDASINPGNSGGPLINSRGEMIGINTMIFSPSGGSVGVGFAVPIDTAKRILPDLIKYGEVQRGWIDIVYVQLFSRLVQYADLPVDQGLLVSEVISGSLAEKAGIKGGNPKDWVRAGRNIIYLGGDIIIEIDEVPVNTLTDLYSALEDNKPGDVVEVKVVRGKSIKTLQVELSKR